MSPTKTARVATKQIHTLIVDDHTLVRSGLRLLLEAEPDVLVDDEAGGAEEAVRAARGSGRAGRWAAAPPRPRPAAGACARCARAPGARARRWSPGTSSARRD